MVKKKRWGKKFEDNRDWKKYNRHLIQRGVFYIDPCFLDTWLEEIKHMNTSKVGQPYTYPQSMVKYLAVLHSKGFDYRSLQGIMHGLSNRLGPFPVISFSQIRRRILALPFAFKRKTEKMIVGIDGSGVKVSNRGEWMRQKWRVHRGWIKVVILGNIGGDVIDVRVGNENLDERASSRGMLRENGKWIEKALMDGWHDCNDTFNLCDELGIETGIKIRKDASPNGLGKRPREVRLYQELGYKQWAKEKGYGYRWMATEGIFSAVKRIFGEHVGSRKKRNAYREAKLKFWAYQQLRAVG